MSATLPTPVSRYRVLVVDDHAIVRAGLKQVINSDAAFIVSAEAGNASQAIQHLRSGGIDLVLLDISLPDRKILILNGNWI